MESISRRQFSLGLSSLMAANSIPARCNAASSVPDGRVAIIDTSENAAKAIAQLKAKNVKVVARYYARDFQLSLPEKRIAFNKVGNSPESKILTENGIAILSIYQYKNQLAEKFVTGLADTGSPTEEARADARAALDQARAVGQPQRSAIYFGVDFNVREDATDNEGNPLIESILNYFRIVNEVVGDKFRVGAYANGYVNRVLRSKNLISFSWVSPSRSFAETPAFISSGKWQLFQNQVNRRWFGALGECPSGLGVDTNIQNPQFSDVGAWGAASIDLRRTKAIFDERRFVLRATPIFSTKNPDGEPITKQRCILDGELKRWKLIPENTIQRANNVRVLSDDGTWAQVDIDDDGEADGYCLKENLTRDFNSMPNLSLN